MLVMLWPSGASATRLVSNNVKAITTIPFQGRLLLENGEAFTDTLDMVFRLYATPTGSIAEALWVEQLDSIVVREGFFTALLGEINTSLVDIVAGNDILYLGVTVGDGADEMLPRIPLGSAPFALTVPDNAITSEKIMDGEVKEDDIEDGAVKTPKIADLAVTGAKIDGDAIITTKIADRQITNEKIALGEIDSSLIADGSIPVSKLASMTGIVWKTPPYLSYEQVEWAPPPYPLHTWDISTQLIEAGVPEDAEMILLGWQPTRLSDISTFILRDESGTELGSVVMGTLIARWLESEQRVEYPYPATGIPYGAPIPVPGAVRRIEYEGTGGYYTDTPTEYSRRSLVIFGWK
jgi:hypothetical protein